MTIKKPVLYIVATPIGNWKDISLRALEVLKSVNVLICEEYRQGSTLLKKLELPKKELIALNEHNEEEVVPEIINRMVMGESMALVSDCGTPVFADPGHYLIEQAIQFQVEVKPIPGASSLMATLSVLDFNLDRFYFAGFLPREKSERKQAIQSLRNLHVPIVLMDTPYRLTKLLEEVASTFGKNRRITLAMDITLDNELILRGSVSEIQKRVQNKKSEFVLVVHE